MATTISRFKGGSIFLLGYLKTGAVIGMPAILQQLKRANTSQEINNIATVALEIVMNSAVARALNCFANSGGLLKEIVFYT